MDKPGDADIQPQHRIKSTNQHAMRSASTQRSGRQNKSSFFICWGPRYYVAVVVGFARTGDGHDHRQGATFARADACGGGTKLRNTREKTRSKNKKTPKNTLPHFFGLVLAKKSQKIHDVVPFRDGVEDVIHHGVRHRQRQHPI